VELMIRNKYFEPLCIVDGYTSLIWVKRYYHCGDFELYIPANRSLLQYIKPNYYVTRDDDDSFMIIEKLHVKEDAENGDYFIISGRSLESILLRRVEYGISRYVNESSPLSAIWQYMYVFFMNPNDSSRYVPNFYCDTSGVTIEEEITDYCYCKTAYDIVTSILVNYDFGMKMTYDYSQEKIIMSFYRGSAVDVVFSSEFDNLISADYEFDITNIATQAFVRGKNEDYQFVETSQERGLDKREVYVDAQNVEVDQAATAQEYRAALRERGKEALATEYSVHESFEADVEPEVTFRYKTDWNLGDTVTVVNRYGVTSHPKIVEVIECWDETGYKVIPTFDSLEVV